MIGARELSKPEFEACWSLPMKDVTKEVSNPIDIWPYVDAINPTAIGVGGLRDVELVYQDAKARYHHVLVQTDQKNVFLVVIVDIQTESVFGHHLLDLNEKYGIKAATPAAPVSPD